MLKLADTVKQYIVIAVNWLKNNRQLIATIARIAGIVAAVGIGIMVFGAVMYGASAAIGVVVGIISTLGSAIGIAGAVLAAILSPIGLVVAAIVGLGAYFLHTTGTITQAVDWLKRVFGELFQEFYETWSAISGAIAAGDLKLAMKVLWSALKMEWQKGTHWITEKWIGRVPRRAVCFMARRYAPHIQLRYQASTVAQRP